MLHLVYLFLKMSRKKCWIVHCKQNNWKSPIYLTLKVVTLLLLIQVAKEKVKMGLCLQIFSKKESLLNHYLLYIQEDP